VFSQVFGPTKLTRTALVCMLEVSVYWGKCEFNAPRVLLLSHKLHRYVVDDNLRLLLNDVDATPFVISPSNVNPSGTLAKCGHRQFSQHDFVAPEQLWCATCAFLPWPNLSSCSACSAGVWRGRPPQDEVTPGIDFKGRSLQHSLQRKVAQSSNVSLVWATGRS
jgi:hypothetical protein